MLLIGLTGGIAAGKSSVSTRLAEHGLHLIDADVLARHAVAPGTPGLAAVVRRFGADVLTADGELDRPALGQRVFSDEASRADLNAIVHPEVRRLYRDELASLPEDAIVVHDVPLLVENGMQADYHLVLVVTASVHERLRRMKDDRGMPEEEARSRMAAQASDARRRAAADVVIDNTGTRARLEALVDRLVDERIRPYAENLEAGRPVRPPARVVPSDPEWPLAARRLAARVRRALQPIAGEQVVVEHIGRTAVPGLAAPDVIELQASALGLQGEHAAGAERLLRAAGYFREGDDVLHGADPGRPVSLWLHEPESQQRAKALELRDWLRLDADAAAALGTAGLEDEVSLGDWLHLEGEQRLLEWCERAAGPARLDVPGPQR